MCLFASYLKSKTIERTSYYIKIGITPAFETTKSNTFKQHKKVHRSVKKTEKKPFHQLVMERFIYIRKWLTLQHKYHDGSYKQLYGKVKSK